MAKLRNISYIVKEIAINSSTTNYELNGIVGNNLEFYGLDKITGNYKELPKAWYQLIKNNGNYVFKVVDPSIFNYSKIQVALWYDNKSLTYVTEFNPDIKVLVDRYNILVNTVSQLWEYTKRQMIVGDSMEMHLILPKLKSEELWICKGDHYEAISITNVNEELRKMIDMYADMYKKQFEQKTEEQKRILNDYTNEQKTVLEIYKNEKINDLLSELTKLKTQLGGYANDKKEEIRAYGESVKSNLFIETKKKVDDYLVDKNKSIEENITKKAKEAVDNLDGVISNKVQLKIDVLFEKSTPILLKTLKDKIDEFLTEKIKNINTSIEKKVDDYIASRDELIKKKVEDIATAEVGEAVKKAKDNILKNVQEELVQKKQAEINSFTNQVNIITNEKIKLISDSLNSFMNNKGNEIIREKVKETVNAKVNEDMKTFNVTHSIQGNKVKLTFTLKDFHKEIEFPSGENLDGNAILNRINGDVDKTSSSLETFKKLLDIKHQDLTPYLQTKDFINEFLKTFDNNVIVLRKQEYDQLPQKDPHKIYLIEREIT